MTEKAILRAIIVLILLSATTYVIADQKKVYDSIVVQPVEDISALFAIQVSRDGTGDIEYVGYAKPGTATSVTRWQIKKVTYTDSNIDTVGFADGNDQFDNEWDERTGYTYN